MDISTSRLIKFRKKILILDKKLIAILNERVSISSKIGKIKYVEKINIQQEKFWKESSRKRKIALDRTTLRSAFAKKIFLVIHKESIKIQKQVIIESQK